VVGGAGDAGIDGVINEDRLGLDTIYVQAKRWEGTVGRPEIQRFAGALQGQRARKGVFITTSAFSAEAEYYAGQIDTKIILIDGPKLADLMVEHGIGVTDRKVYRVGQIDSERFMDEQEEVTT
jgi:restriction system protein